MADHAIPHFQNTNGYKSINIGAREFMCIGANPPFDHPHVFLDMGAEQEIICPYCSTLYLFNPELAETESHPENCHYSFDKEAA